MPGDTDISDEAVERATGRTWSDWFKLLDKWGAKAQDHKTIATHLAEGHGLSGWWSQTVTVQYERARGLRKVGQTSDGGYQVGVMKTLNLDEEAAWRLVTGPRGTRIWLGPGAPRTLKEGATFTLQDGTQGEVRVVKPVSHVRLTWKPPGWKRASVVQVRVLPRAGDRAAIQFHHEALPRAKDREAMRGHWKKTLEQLAS